MIKENRTFVLTCDGCGEERFFTAMCSMGATIKDVFEEFRYQNRGMTRWSLVGDKTVCSVYCEGEANDI